jgi:hypothetical protein
MTIEDVSRDEWERYEAPVLLYDIARIRANISELAAACAGNPGHMLFAVKSFPAARILVMAYEIGMGFEVSAEQEYQMLPSDLSGRIVSLNSPFPLSSDRFLWAGNLLQNQQNSLAETQSPNTPYRPHSDLYTGTTQSIRNYMAVVSGKCTAISGRSRFWSTPSQWIGTEQRGVLPSRATYNS